MTTPSRPRPTTASPKPAEQGDKPLRKDAEMNRQRVLDAAARLFAERGADIGYDEIARVAGVGVGTVYRRFPDRSALLKALVATRYEQVLTRLEKVLDDPGTDGVLEQFLVAFVQEAARDAGFRDSAQGSREDDPLENFHVRIAGLFDRAIHRAQQAGDVRNDVVAEDLATLTTLLSHLRGEENVVMVPRYVALLLEGLRTRPMGSTLPGPIPSPDQTMRLVRQNLG